MNCKWYILHFYNTIRLLYIAVLMYIYIYIYITIRLLI